MDGRRFDELSRMIASGSTRRGAIRVALGAVLVGAAARSGAPAAAQLESAGKCGADGDRCQQQSDCCKGLTCRNNRCRYKNNCGGQEGDFCQRNGDCCSKIFCCESQCTKCKGYACGSNNDCCNGFVCKKGRCK